MSYPVISGRPADVDDATPRMCPGTIVMKIDTTYGTELYKYVQFKDAVTYAAGQPLGWSAGDSGLAVTNDVSEDNGVAAGVATRVHTQNYYGFMQVAGLCTVVTNGDDDIADGAVIILGTGDGACDSGSDPGLVTALGIAVAADSDSANTVLTLLRGLV